MNKNKRPMSEKENEVGLLTKTIDSLANGSVLLVGILLCVVAFLPVGSIFQNASLSVGCSLVATYIATHYAKKGDRQPAMEKKLDRIERRTEEISGMQVGVMMDALSKFGIFPEQYYRLNARNAFPGGKGKEQLEESVRKSMENYRIDHKFTVGKHNPVEQDYYYDLIGGTCDSVNAESFARMLSAYWNAILTDEGLLEHPEFDFVVTPKGGSPILGYEFAKLINRPFVLHEDKKRFADNENDPLTYFNYYKAPKNGATALIVDDSTTGGRMVAETVDHLRKFGYRVHTCLVVFAPQTKDAAARLKSKNVQLVSIIKTHETQDKN